MRIVQENAAPGGSTRVPVCGSPAACAIERVGFVRYRLEGDKDRGPAGAYTTRQSTRGVGDSIVVDAARGRA